MVHIQGKNKLKFVSVARAQVIKQIKATGNRLIFKQKAHVKKIMSRAVVNMVKIKQKAMIKKVMSRAVEGKLILNQAAEGVVQKAQFIHEFNDSGGHRGIVVVGNKCFISEWWASELGFTEIDGVIYCWSNGDKLPGCSIIAPVNCARRKV